MPTNNKELSRRLIFSFFSTLSNILIEARAINKPHASGIRNDLPTTRMVIDIMKMAKKIAVLNICESEKNIGLHDI